MSDRAMVKALEKIRRIRPCPGHVYDDDPDVVAGEGHQACAAAILAHQALHSPEEA